MGFRYVYYQPMVSLAARAAAGQSNAFKVVSYNEGILFVKVTAKAGTLPNLKVLVEVSPNNSDWYQASESNFDAEGNFSLEVDNFVSYIRARWEISGTNPSFTFSIDGQFKS